MDKLSNIKFKENWIKIKLKYTFFEGTLNVPVCQIELNYSLDNGPIYKSSTSYVGSYNSIGGFPKKIVWKFLKTSLNKIKKNIFVIFLREKIPPSKRDAGKPNCTGSPLL